eukprot:Skav228725  [mRNA]  locus=scaffold1830:282844:287556:- [translate_table: standard]
MDAVDSRYAAQFDIHTRPDIFAVTHCNILVTDLEVRHGQLMGRLCGSGLPNVRDWSNNMFLKPITLTDQALLFQCHDELRAEILKRKYVLLYDVEFGPLTGEIERGMLQVKTKPSTLFVPWDEDSFDDEWMMDLCCGGFGGWSRGIHHLASYFPVPRKVLGIDCDLPSSVFHAINLDTIWYPEADMTPFFLQNLDRSITLYASLEDHHWKQAAAFLHPSIWTFSFPCPSWSQAGYGRGFSVDSGKVFLRGMLLARIFKPKYMLLENVQGFQESPEFYLALHIISFCGFRVLFQTVADVHERLPTRRPRWICILEHMSIPRTHTFRWESWLPAFHNPVTWGAVIPPDHKLLTPFWLSKALSKIYLDPELFPPAVRHQAKKNPLKQRAPPVDHKPMTFMAAYGHQHELPESLIRSKGLLGPLVLQQNRLRFWTPPEICMLHCQTQAIVLPKPAKLSWKHLGNSLVPHHAILAGFNLFKHVNPTQQHQVPGFTLEDILQSFEQAHFSLNATTIIEDELAWYLGKPDQIHQLQQRTHQFARDLGFDGEENPTVPTNCFWHPDHGVQTIQVHELPDATISPTMQFVAEAADPDQHTQLDSSGEEECIRHFLADQPVEPLEHQEDHMNNMQVQPPGTVPIKLFFSPGVIFELQVHSQIKWNDLLSLWQGQFAPTQDFGASELARLVRPATLHQVDESIQIAAEGTPLIMIVNHDNQVVTILPFASETTWSVLQEHFGLLGHTPYDQIGILLANTRLRCRHRVSDLNVLSLELSHDPDLHAHLAAVQVSSFSTGANDEIFFLLEGPTVHLVPTVMLWKLVCDNEWLHAHGRKLQTFVVNPTCYCVMFPPDLEAFPTPAQLFRDAISMRLLQTALTSLNTPGFALRLLCKVDCRILKTLIIDPAMSTQAIVNIVQAAMQTIPSFHHVTLRSRDTIISHETTCDAFHFEHTQHGLAADCHINWTSPTLRLQGGGGSRTEHRQTVMAALASLCVGSGIPLSEVPSTVQTIQKAIPITQLTALTMQENPDKQTKLLAEIFEACDIRPTKQAVDLGKVQKKFQRIGHSKQAEAAKKIDPQQYQLSPGFFLLSNDEPADIHAHYSPYQPGVTMMTVQEAMKWSGQRSITPDESAIFIIGDLPPEDQQRCVKITAPATTQQGACVLIAGWLLQLGEKQIKVLHADATPHELRDVQVCSFTLWSSDFSPDQWQQCVASPVRFANQLLEKEQLQGIIQQPWGRTFRSGQTPCPSSQATSVQFHAQVQIKDLRRLLRRSGWCGLFITPKDQNGKPSDRWKPIWHDMPRDMLEARSSSLSGVAGYIRGKKSHGIRVEIATFEIAWRKLKPDSPLPVFPTGVSFRVRPLPFGVDLTILREWLESINWPATPLRSIGARTWVVSSECNPPKGLVTFNGQPVLITTIKPRSPAAQTGIVAGPKPTASQTKAASSTQNPFRSGDPWMDPWAGASQTPTPAQPPTTGATANRLEAQDKKIEDLHQAISKLTDNQQAVVANVEQRLHNFETNIQTFQSQSEQAFCTFNRQDFETTVANALKNQDQKLQTSMDEIKNLLLRREKRKTAEEDDDEM